MGFKETRREGFLAPKDSVWRGLKMLLDERRLGQGPGRERRGALRGSM